ncbi:MAG: DUF2852 domain-containing protein, partial [Beijerinckiaceae bacterium]
MTDFAERRYDIRLKLDELGRPAWIALMVLGFILFWPLGLGLLFYIIWSGRMGCGHRRYGASDEERRAHWERKMGRMQEKMSRWAGGPSRGFAPTGNRAFDEYRESMMKRLEDEAQEFQDFLSRLRMARDKAEFDQYMSDRQSRGDRGDQG